MEPLEFKLRPPSALPVPFFLAGLLGLAAFLSVASVDPRATLAFPPDPDGVLLLHLAALGFLAPVMLGAYYQLVPVVLHAPVVGGRFGICILAALVAGVAVFLCGWAWAGSVWVAAGGALAGAALYGFLVHMVASLARLRRFSITAAAFTLALAFLAVTAVLGPALALSIGGLLPLPGFTRLLPAHAAAGLSGWLLLTVVGASYQLIAFFGATPPSVRPRFGYVAVGAIALGAAALAGGVRPPGAAGGLALAGLVFWAADLVRLARHGRQARREPVVTFSGLAVALLVAAAAGGEGLLLVPGGPASAVVACGLLGLVTSPALLVLGQLQKILPFLASLDVALAAKRRGAAPKTEALFPRRTAFGLLAPLAAGLVGIALAAGTGSALGVRLAAAVAALATYGYLYVQWRAARVWWRARRIT